MIEAKFERLMKLKDRIYEIITKELNLKVDPVEFDIVPPIKMIEIMAYRSPINISNWKYGRDFEKLRTIYENIDKNLPYEVVINSNPARAYLMNTNPIAVQALVIAHVYGHCNFFTENVHFKNSRKDILTILSTANERFNKFERSFGIDIVEKTIDAGHSLQLHSNPMMDDETEDEKRKRVYNQIKLELQPTSNIAKFDDIVSIDKEKNVQVDIELRNQYLWDALKTKTPVEKTEDLLRYIIDNSYDLQDWQKDILETLRTEGQYYWPVMKTKYANEGWATFIHEKVMNQLFEEGLLDDEDHGQYVISNALVKAESPFISNPYLIGSKIWEDIEMRWNKGKHGDEYKNCTSIRELEQWDTKEMKGFEKCIDVMRTCSDWFLMHEFMTTDLIKESKIYLYKQVDKNTHIDYEITDHTTEQIRQIIINSFSISSIPTILVEDGNHLNKGILRLVHNHDGYLNLEPINTIETLRHINFLWGRTVVLQTMDKNKHISIVVKKGEFVVVETTKEMEVL